MKIYIPVHFFLIYLLKIFHSKLILVNSIPFEILLFFLSLLYKKNILQKFPLRPGFRFINDYHEDDRIRGTLGPSSTEECEVNTF
jgi:hypothetical protein